MRAVWQATIADFQGNIQPGAQVSLRLYPGLTLVPAFTTRDGMTSAGNPLTADAQGFARGYVEPGLYRITATFGAGTRTWDHVVLLDDVPEVSLPAVVEGDFLLANEDDELEAVNFAALVRAYANVPNVYGATFTGFNQAVAVPVNDVPRVVPFDGTITEVIVLTTGGTGNAVLDIWKVAYSSYPPVSGDTICASAKPTISTGTKYRDTTLTGWTTAVSAGDTLKFHLQSSGTFTAIAIFVVVKPLGSSDPEGYTDARVREIVAEMLETGGVEVVGSTYNVTAIGASGPVNLWSLIGQPSGAVTVNYSTPPGGIVSQQPNVPALDLRGFASGSTLNVTVLGPLLGSPGPGGDGAGIGNTYGEDGGSGRRGISGLMAQPGKNGGPAIVGPGTGVTFNLAAANGYVFGGGGGGGGGGASLDFGGDNNAAAGGGGGAGAGGARGGKGGRVPVSNSTTAATATANPGVDSTGGLTGALGTGGTGAGNGSGTGGTGGDGGTWGADGSDGASPTTYDRDYAGASKGLAGKAIDLNGGAVTITSGNNSTHIKGAVS